MQAGRLWRTDADGFLCNDADSVHLHSSPYTVAIADAVATYQQQLGDDLHSVYVTGSVARGLAVPGQSDLNTCAVTVYSADPELIRRAWIPKAEDTLSQQHSIASQVRLDAWAQAYIFTEPEAFSVESFILKTQSVCVWGSDIWAELPSFSLNDAVTRMAIANGDLVQIADDIDEAVSALADAPTKADLHYWSSQIARQMLRTGASLSLIQQPTYTRDVDRCAQIFSQAYPQQAAAIAQTLHMAQQAPDDARAVLSLLDTFGGWLIEEAEGWLDVHNPERELAFAYPEAE